MTIEAPQFGTTADFTPEEQRDYVIAVIVKQTGISHVEAAERAAKLAAEEHDALHDAGRAGRIAEVCELLGL